MKKYGIEYIHRGKSTVTMYKDDEQAKAEAEELALDMKPSDYMMLFTAECDNEGKLASNLRHVIKTWGKPR